jgi:hypothetical protein
MGETNQERPGPETVKQSSPKGERKPASNLTGAIAVGFGVLATFLWTFVATLNSPGKPGAGVDLHISVLVGLIGTAIGACIGVIIDRLRS